MLRDVTLSNNAALSKVKSSGFVCLILPLAHRHFHVFLIMQSNCGARNNNDSKLLWCSFSYGVVLPQGSVSHFVIVTKVAEGGSLHDGKRIGALKNKLIPTSCVKINVKINCYKIDTEMQTIP
jgi:hypothetical protein